MTKADIVAKVAKETGCERELVMYVVESFMDNVKKSMCEGNEIFLRGFGSFILKERAQKTARNISKNTTLIIPEHTIPAFKPCKDFKDSVKSGR